MKTDQPLSQEETNKVLNEMALEYASFGFKEALRAIFSQLPDSEVEVILENLWTSSKVYKTLIKPSPEFDTRTDGTSTVQLS